MIKVYFLKACNTLKRLHQPTSLSYRQHPASSAVATARTLPVDPRLCVLWQMDPDLGRLACAWNVPEHTSPQSSSTVFLPTMSTRNRPGALHA